MKLFKNTPASFKILLPFAIMAFVTYGNTDEQKEELKLKARAGLKSVSFENGKYKVDSFIVWRYNTKKSFLDLLNTDSLSESKTIAEIPVFIRAFLDSISPKGKFDIVNPGQPFYIEDITNYGKHGAKGDIFLLPDKQLISFGLGKHIAMISFYCGGGLGETQNVTLIKFSGKKITDLWYENANPFVLSKTEIIKYLNKKPQGGGGC